MVKVRRLSENQLIFDFHSIQEKKQLYYQSFLSSDLGKLYQALPLEELVGVLQLKESKKGPKSYFPPKGQLALMFLKHYTGLSDKKLLEALNWNLSYQFFCGILIDPLNPLTNFKVISEIRVNLANKLNWQELQSVLGRYWQPYLQEPDRVVADASCYPSHIRYPTDVKLLWESVSWLYGLLQMVNRDLGKRMIRSKYGKWSARYSQYSKKKRKSVKEGKRLRRGLLHLLKKMVGELDPLLKRYGPQKLSVMALQRYATIKAVYPQQWNWLEKGEKPSNRIVSLDKPYLRPIVRGKEKNKVEFGAKVSSFQIDGISFIHQISFDNFNECKDFKPLIFQAQKITKKKVQRFGGDKIYATNENRKFATKHGIQTDFAPKGRKSKDEKERKKKRRRIAKERASRMEGSFGTEKQYYLLDKVRARSKETEVFWIFLGIHTANAVRMGNKMCQQPQKKKTLSKAA